MEDRENHDAGRFRPVINRVGEFPDQRHPNIAFCHWKPMGLLRNHRQNALNLRNEIGT